MTVFKEYHTDDLRRAYMPGRKRTGWVDVSKIGLTYRGKPIGVIEFRRGGDVAYYETDAPFCFASFTNSKAVLDD